MEIKIPPKIGGVAFLLAPGLYGGAENIALFGCKELGATLWVIKETRNPGPAEYFLKRARQEGVPIKIFRCDSRFDFKTLIDLRAAAKNDKIRIVHSHGMKANFYCSLMSVTKIGTQHGKTSHDIKVKWLEKIEDLSFKRMNGLICVSEKQRKFYRHKNKAHIENFLRRPPKKNDYKSAGPVELLFVGRLSKEKGLDELLTALEDLPQARLTIAGDGPERQKLIDANKGVVKWLGFQEDVLPLYAQADALIMPSHREGLPLAALEAAAAGLPILASSVGALPEIAKGNGILFKPGDPGEIVMAVRDFIKRRSKINDAAKKGREIILKTYCASRWAEKVKEVYAKA